MGAARVCDRSERDRGRGAARDTGGVHADGGRAAAVDGGLVDLLDGLLTPLAYCRGRTQPAGTRCRHHALSCDASESGGWAPLSLVLPFPSPCCVNRAPLRSP